jgi:hypothetical protein
MAQGRVDASNDAFLSRFASRQERTTHLPERDCELMTENDSIQTPARQTDLKPAQIADRAIACAKVHATRVLRPTRIACRLATAQDLGCTRVQS